MYFFTVRSEDSFEEGDISGARRDGRIAAVCAILGILITCVAVALVLYFFVF